MLASMRLCANVPGQYAIQTALGGYQSIDDLVAPTGACAPARPRLGADQRRSRASAASSRRPRCTCSRAWTPRSIRSRTTSSSSLELLLKRKSAAGAGQRLQLAHPGPLPPGLPAHEDDLRDAIGRIARFLENYRKRHGT
jgi:alanine-synthesizing transaminase